MNLKSLLVTASLYAESVQDLSDTVEALESMKKELVQAQESLKAADSKKAELEAKVALLEQKARRGQGR